MSVMGIYRINGPKNRIYFGSSNNINRRKQDHRSQLNSNRHDNKRLQNDWIKYGEDFFTFTVVEIIDNVDDLLSSEQDYLDWVFRYIDTQERYNMLRVAGRKTGCKHTTASRNKISKALKNKPKTNNHRQSIRKSMLGKQLSEETKQKVSSSNKGKHNKKFPNRTKKYYGKVVDLDNNVYDVIDLNSFCKLHGLVYSCMCRLFSNERKQHLGWKLYDG